MNGYDETFWGLPTVKETAAEAIESNYGFQSQTGGAKSNHFAATSASAGSIPHCGNMKRHSSVGIMNLYRITPVPGLFKLNLKGTQGHGRTSKQ